MPGYWITTHWPHPIPDDHPWNVYVSDPNSSRGRMLQPGDKVLFREARYYMRDGKRATHIVKVCPDGRRLQIALRKGDASIIGVATITSTLGDMSPDQLRFSYGGTEPWPKQAKCSPLIIGKPVKYKPMLEALELHPDTPANTTFGLYPIESQEKFERLVGLMGLGPHKV